MRIVMAATGDFALPTFRALLASPHQVAALITQPDRPSGRGRKVKYQPIKREALEAGIEVHQPRLVRDPSAIELVASLSPDVLLVIAYGQKIPQAVCDLAPSGALNLHGSLLPALRGAAPCNWAIVNGFETTGVTVIALAQRMDAGDMLGQAQTAIGPRETAPQLYQRLADVGAELVLQVLRQIEQGTSQRIAQNEAQVTYAPRLRKEDGLIDWRYAAQEIDHMVRGLKPWPGGFTYLRRSVAADAEPLRLILEEVEPVPMPDGARAQPGEVVQAGRELLVAAGAGAVKIVRLKPESSKAMAADAFCNGHQVKPGDMMGHAL